MCSHWIFQDSLSYVIPAHQIQSPGYFDQHAEAGVDEALLNLDCISPWILNIFLLNSEIIFSAPCHTICVVELLAPTLGWVKMSQAGKSLHDL